jgi:hypothetical protein
MYLMDSGVTERLVETPTSTRLRATTRSSRYRYGLAQVELQRLRESGLGPAPILAFMAILAASKAAGGGWVTLRPAIRSGWGFSVEWWRVNTSALEKAGIIDCERRPSQLPRYRLKGDDASDDGGAA